MKTKRFDSNRVLLYIKGIVSFVLVCVIVIFGINVVSQTEKKADNQIMLEQKRTNHQDSQDEVQKLIEILENDKNKEKSPQLVAETILKLGSIRDERAIPELVKYLDYERIFESVQNQDSNLKIDPIEVTHWQDRPPMKRFPAIESLFQIGESSLPTLIEVIKEEESKSLKSQNALYTIQFIFRDDLSKTVKYLEDAMSNSVAQERKQRLLKASDKIAKEIQRLKKSKTQ